MVTLEAGKIKLVLEELPNKPQKVWRLFLLINEQAQELGMERQSFISKYLTNGLQWLKLGLLEENILDRRQIGFHEAFPILAVFGPYSRILASHKAGEKFLFFEAMNSEILASTQITDQEIDKWLLELGKA